MPVQSGSGDDSNQLVLKDRVQSLYRQRIESVASGLLVGAMLAVALLRVHTWQAVLLWYVGICVVQFGRGTLLGLSRFRKVQVNDPARWGRRYVVDVTVAGLYWGVSLAVLVQPDDLPTQSFVAMALGGMAVGSITLHAYHRPVMYAFLGCLLLPFIARVMWIGDFAHLYLGLGMLLLATYLAVFGRFHAGTLERSIAVRHENRQLIAQLQNERETAVKLQAAAEEASRAKSRFFAGASHDLRQPLQALSLYANVLSESRLPEDLHQVSVRVGQSVRVLEDLFEGVLDIAHVEAGGMEIRREPVQVQQLMDRALLLFGGEALDKGLSIKCSPCSLWVVGDALALQRVVSNLVANAVRHTRQGRVLLGARRRGAVLRLMVADTGPGIDAGDTARIFDEFYRSPSASGHGFGLGLATVKRLCDAAGYPLGLSSKPGRGTVFWVELVRTEPPAPELVNPAPQELAAAQGSLYVLLVEDDPAARGAVETILRSWGHACSSFESADAVLAGIAAMSQSPDVLISDYDLPGGRNGLQTIGAVRAATQAALAAVLISGTMDAALRDAAAQANCIALAKPVRPLQLRSVVDLIASRQLEARRGD
jgi:signal transduction histidine kinase